MQDGCRAPTWPIRRCSVASWTRSSAATSKHWTHPDDLPESFEDPIGLLASGHSDRVQFEQRYLHRAGCIISALVTAASFWDEDGRRAAVIQVLDVSERKQIEGQLQHLADHDPLTGLFNRRRFHEELERELNRARFIR